MFLFAFHLRSGYPCISVRNGPLITSTHKQRSEYSFTNLVDVHVSIGVFDTDLVHVDPIWLKKRVIDEHRGGDLLPWHGSMTRMKTSLRFLSSRVFTPSID